LIRVGIPRASVNLLHLLLRPLVTSGRVKLVSAISGTAGQAWRLGANAQYRRRSPVPNLCRFCRAPRNEEGIAVLVSHQRRAIGQLALLAHQQTVPRHVCRFDGTPGRLMPARPSSACVAFGPCDRFRSRSSVSDRFRAYPLAWERRSAWCPIDLVVFEPAPVRRRNGCAEGTVRSGLDASAEGAAVCDGTRGATGCRRVPSLRSSSSIFW
jgi:hypothetical protein